jgi:hypothetical protein
MAKFLTSNELNAALEKLFVTADEELILISPYIKLHERFSSALSLKKENPKLKITVVFGKNEDDLRKSMNIEDLQFFIGFPNIEIRYEKRLHAKYYANDDFAIITSMNLHKFSQDTNIEAGIRVTFDIKELLPKSIRNYLGLNLDGESSEYFKRVAKQATLIFQKVPVYDNGFLKTRILRKYLQSEITLDKLQETFKLIASERAKFKTRFNPLNTTHSTYRPVSNEFSMGNLYSELIKEYEFPKKPNCPDATYVYICNVAKEIYNFQNQDFKLDQSALKRTTILDSDKYHFLKKTLINQAVPKRTNL